MTHEVRIITNRMPLVLKETEILGRLPVELVYKGWRQGQENPLFKCPICGTLCLHVVDPEIREKAEAAERQALKIQRKGVGKKMEGTVKFFNKKRGYGFIAGEDKKDYFVHYTGIAKEENRNFLNQGQLVKFGVVQDKRGPKAVNVIVVKESA